MHTVNYLVRALYAKRVWDRAGRPPWHKGGGILAIRRRLEAKANRPSHGRYVRYLLRRDAVYVERRPILRPPSPRVSGTGFR